MPEIEGDKPARKRFASYPIGYVHIDIAEVRTGEGKLRLFVAIDRTSKLAFAHIFDRVCIEHGIEHRLTEVNHPWTNGQVQRMNGSIKDATVRRYHYDSHDQLRTHLALFLDGYNHARRLKTLRGLTPYEFVYQTWTREPGRFRPNPSHHIPGPYKVKVPL